MQTLEYDHTEHTRPNAGDDSLLVKFFIDVVQDNKASEAEGRPMFKDAEWIDIRIPGNRDNVVIRPVREADKQRFPRHYAAFKQRIAGQEITVEGTPLSAWPYPGMTPSRVKELDFFNIRTVEQLAATSDGTGAKLHGFQAMKQAAIVFLAAAKETAPVAKLQKQIDEMQAVIKKQADLIERLSKSEE
jgi:hypothetical protein